jgi:hypothetical protein
MGKKAEGELNENKTCIWIDIAGSGGSSRPAKCRDRNREGFALAVFAAPGTDDTRVNGCGAPSGFTFRNLFPQEIEDCQVTDQIFFRRECAGADGGGFSEVRYGAQDFPVYLENACLASSSLSRQLNLGGEHGKQ